MDENNIISIADIIEVKLRKQKELDFYREQVEILMKKIREAEKELNINQMIIDLIQKDQIRAIEDKKR